MSLVDNTQLMEKKKQKFSFDFFREIKEQSEKGSEQALVFKNCLAGISTNLSAIDININHFEKAQIYRLLATCTDKNIEEKTNLIKRKLAQLSLGCFSKSSLADSADFVLQCINYDESAKQLDTARQIRLEPIFKSFTGGSLQFETTEDSTRTMIEDESFLDPVCGIPVCHLTFIMKHTLPMKMFCKPLFLPPLLEHNEILYQPWGYLADITQVRLLDLSATPKMEQSYCRSDKSKSKKIVILKNDLVAIHESRKVKVGPNYLFINDSDTKPGYCRLQLPPASSVDDDGSFDQLGANRYLKPLNIPDVLCSQMEAFGEIRFIGVLYTSSPFLYRWTERRRKFDFPSRKLIDYIIRQGCILVPKSHPKSAFPDIEWQCNFYMAEFLIFKSLTLAQKHGFYVLNVMLDKINPQLALKPNLLENFYLTAREEIPSRAWETNFCGCVLHVLDSLLIYLKNMFLPNYFIPESILIDSYSELDISLIIAKVEYFRLFPAFCIQIVAEKHGCTHARNPIKHTVGGVKEFTLTKNRPIAFNNLFRPVTQATAKIMAKRGFNTTSYNMLEDAFEQSLLIQQEGMRQTSVSFFNHFVKAVVAMKQRSSRFILSEIFDRKTGFNASEIWKKPVLSLQDSLEWTVDFRLSWIEVPSEMFGDLKAISTFLYECSKREYYRRNKVLSQLTIITAVQCIQEILKQNPHKVDKTDSDSLSSTESVETQVVKRKLFLYFRHMYLVSMLDFMAAPLSYYIDEIENLCKGFPEMTGMVSKMFAYVNLPAKSQQYANMFNDYIFGEGSLHREGFRGSE